ncbi:MAG TPA: iron-sulfur cluster assembly accessory protein [Leptolyngbyaceae cyanobacterium]
MIHISQAAIKELKRLQAKQRTLNPLIRLGLQEGGCSQWSYVIEFEVQPHSEDTLVEYGDLRVVISQTAISTLNGLTIDYAEDLMGGSFRFVNPNAVQTCGCGISFSTSAEVN